MKNLFYRIYLSMAIFNTVVALLSIAGVIAYGATWHIGTFVLAAWLALELFAEARRERRDPEHEPVNTILKQEIWQRK